MELNSTISIQMTNPISPLIEVDTQEGYIKKTAVLQIFVCRHATTGNTDFLRSSQNKTN
jgi:hypothetical protein